MRRAVAKIKSLPPKQFRRPPLKKPLSKNVPVKRKAEIIAKRKGTEKIIVPEQTTPI